MKSLTPVEKVYHFFVGTKNFFYDHKFINSIRLKIPVVSVGNLSFGGVGKTPFIIFLSEVLHSEFKINIISKSYKASLTEPKKVDLTLSCAAAIFGDEACLLQTKLPACAVWSGPNKALTAAASMSSQPDLILVDDGFSHRKLHRNFDIVLIDATEGLNGYLRESVNNLQRAHAVLITKANLASTEAVSAIKNKIVSIAPMLNNIIFTANIKTTLRIAKKDPVYVFCGLARPRTFIQDLTAQGFNLVATDFYSDHFGYPVLEQKSIYKKYLKLKKKYVELKIVTTEKDFVKIQDEQLKKILILPDHKIEMEALQMEVLLAKIRQSL